jgi:hypothetical protein
MSESTQQPPPGSARLLPKTSALAVTALILAVIPCCPLVNLAGVTIGITALKRIERSGGALGGKRIAKSAIAVGLALSVLLAAAWMMFTVQYQRHVDEEMQSISQGFVLAAIDGHARRARQFWTPERQQQVSEQAIEEFGKQVAARFGRLSGINFSVTSGSGSLFEPHIDAACVFTFESSKRTGSVSFRLVPSGNSVWPIVKLRQFRINDAERGDLILGAAAETP